MTADLPSHRARDIAAERFIIVLNEPQDVVNVAATVRAMTNMGLRRLRLVQPAEFDPRRIQGIAHNAEAVLERVQHFETLRQALIDTTHVVGTTARRRTARFVWQHPREAAPELAALAAAGEDVALVFGREDTGLDNEALDRCDRLLNIPTDPDHRSLNLAQAVLLVCYELWIAGPGAERPLPRARKKKPPATWEQHQLLFEDTERALHALDFFKTRQPSALMRTIRAVARRAVLDRQEANLLRAIAIEVQKKLGVRGRRANANSSESEDGRSRRRRDT